jgi:CheY-like chemotaxis protein
MADAAPSPPTSLPLLIVDDEPEILDLLRAVLEDEGFTVLTASNGAAAFYLIQRTPVALVVTDFMMPQLSGLELAQRLRNNPETAAIPLILMSAAMPRQASDMFAMVIHKPFSIDVIVDMVHHLLPS